MANNTHNTPAFPASVPGHTYGDGSSELPYLAQTGMTMREYFAARAPRDIPGWFEPVMPEFPDSYWIDEDTGVLTPDANLNDATFKARGEFKIIYTAMAKGFRYNNARFAEQERWFRAQRIQKFSQWPWFWADMVIGAQNVKVDAWNEPSNKSTRTEHEEKIIDAIGAIRDYIMQVEPNECASEEIRDEVHSILKQYSLAV